MKITEKNGFDCQSKVDQLSNELAIHKKLSHPFIVKQYDSFQSVRFLAEKETPFYLGVMPRWRIVLFPSQSGQTQ
jgi:hypothetical protein